MADKGPKDKPLSPARERFAAEVGINGKNPTQAALAASEAGTTPEAAAVTAHRMMQDERVRERIQEHIKAQTDCTAEEVVGTLVAHMRADVTDCLRDDGTLDLTVVRALRMGHLIKSLTVQQMIFTPAKTGDAEEPANVLSQNVIKVEFHSQQAAAIQLCKVFGIEQQARENERDAKIRRRVAAALERLAKRFFNGDIEKAKLAYLKGAPGHQKYLM